MDLGDLLRGALDTVDKTANEVTEAVKDTREKPRLDWTTIDGRYPRVKRAIDAEAGVVLYSLKGGDAGGLAAVPLDWTDLKPPEVDEVPER